MKIKIIDAGRRKAPTSGYGLMAYEFGERLRQYNHSITYFDEDPQGSADLWLWIRPPHYVKENYFNPENNNVFFTMHESETFEGWKKDWPQILNKCKAVIVPTEWNKGVFSRAGVTVPIFVCPLGVNTKTFHGYKDLRFSILSMFDGLGSGNARDNWRESVRAYYETFYDNHYREVIYNIKSWRVDYDSWLKFKDALIEEKKYDRAKLPDIQVWEFDLLPLDLNLFYAKNHIFLKNSSGEGWSLPTLEGIACGLRAISRPTPAMLTYLNEKNCDFFESPGELRDKLWQNYRAWRKFKVASDIWSWRNAAKKLDEIINGIITG
jgi:glycosyltransferase involved in cell wall biosynthesis